MNDDTHISDVPMLQKKPSFMGSFILKQDVRTKPKAINPKQYGFKKYLTNDLDYNPK